MRKVLVTGGTGFVGVNLIKALIKNGDEVYALIRRSSKKGTEKLDGIIGVKNIYADPKELINVKNIPQFDVCFNLAAYGVDYLKQDIKEMISGNINFLVDIIEFAKHNKTKLLVHTGTCFEYGLIDEDYIDELSNTNPQSLYGVTKIAGTSIGNIYARINEVNMVTVRPFGIYGPGESVNKLVPQLIKHALNGTSLKMTSGEQIRDYMYIDDLIDAYIKISLSSKIRRYEIYNICSSIPITIKEIVLKLCDACKSDKELFQLGELSYRQNEVMRFVGNNSKLKEVINWEPKISLEEGLKRTFRYYMNK